MKCAIMEIDDLKKNRSFEKLHGQEKIVVEQFLANSKAANKNQRR